MADELADVVREAEEFVESLRNTITQGEQLIEAAKQANDVGALQAGLETIVQQVLADLRDGPVDLPPNPDGEPPGPGTGNDPDNPSEPIPDPPAPDEEQPPQEGDNQDDGTEPTPDTGTSEEKGTA